MRDVGFYALSALAIWSGWRVFRVDSMIRATFSLMVSFIAVGMIALLMSADYIGVATVFMMAVEMMVMGLFMVMFMMNPAGLNPMQMVHQYRFSIGAGVAGFVGLTVAVLATSLPDRPLPAGRDTLRDLGIELLGGSMLIFETAGVTLLATMVGAVVLASRGGRFDRTGEDTCGNARPPGLQPGGAPAGRKVEQSGGHGGHGAEAGPGAQEADDSHQEHGSHNHHMKHDAQEKKTPEATDDAHTGHASHRAKERAAPEPTAPAHSAMNRCKEK